MATYNKVKLMRRNYEKHAEKIGIAKANMQDKKKILRRKPL